MTLDQLINRLTTLRDRIGGDLPVGMDIDQEGRTNQAPVMDVACGSGKVWLMFEESAHKAQPKCPHGRTWSEDCASGCYEPKQSGEVGDGKS